MAIKYGGGQEEKWEIKSLCRFYQPKPSMSEGPISCTQDRSIGGRHIRSPKNEFFLCFSRLSLDCNGTRGLGENLFHITQR